MKQKYALKFPPNQPFQLAQDEAYFFLETTEGEKKIRFHDYAEIYRHTGLYEQLFYRRLKCQSPQKVGALLKKTVEESGAYFTQLRVLDVGAGNGMMGEVLMEYGVARLVGIDILPEAKHAAERDRPAIYDEYFIMNLTALLPEDLMQLQQWHFDCMTTVAALGFGDIPPKAFANAFNLIEENGWIAFNIKETFLSQKDNSGFSTFIKQLILGDYLNLYHLERYRHRLSIDGIPIYYYAIIGRKMKPIEEKFIAELPN
ncbi:MAG: class I SAM-dependent DNA methyltransferase [Candidatus Thermochlorobacter sp.]